MTDQLAVRPEAAEKLWKELHFSANLTASRLL
jgi:hypothetical protein